MAFLRNLLATLIGLFVFTVFIFIILIGIASSSDSSKKTEIAEGSILHLKLNKAIIEKRKSSPFEGFNFSYLNKQGTMGLVELKDAISHAKTNSKIKGIFLEAPIVSAGSATTKAIRDALLDFKKSGKFIFSHADFYTEKSYYLNSVSDYISLPSSGAMDFKGLSVNVNFFKGFFDKFGIEADIFRVGDYKSAVEPFFRESMSEDSREQTTSLLNEINDLYLNEISSSRKIDYKRLKEISSNMLCREPQDAVKFGLIDKLNYQDQVLDSMKSITNTNKAKALNLVSFSDYTSSIKPNPKNINRQKIAIVIAEGDIVSGKSKENKIGDESLIKIFRKLRNNDNIKAIVLRVNSPGGSALASDKIWREIKLTTKQKPVIASMSDLAASGGYYISMACDSILAEPNTITGSIGIFGIRFNVEKLLSEKLGITNSFVKTGKYSDMDYITKPLTNIEKSILQKQVEKGYESFTSKAASDREMPLKSLLKYASGRVWSGSQALDHKLIDKIGNLEDAIEIAASKSKLEENEYALEYYPKSKNQLEQIIEEFTEEATTRFMNSQTSEAEHLLRQVQKLKDYHNLQTRLPYDIEIK